MHMCNTSRQVTLLELQDKAKELNVKAMETSAKNGQNIKALFKDVSLSLYGGKSQKKAPAPSNNTIIQFHN